MSETNPDSELSIAEEDALKFTRSTVKLWLVSQSGTDHVTMTYRVASHLCRPKIRNACFPKESPQSTSLTGTSEKSTAESEELGPWQAWSF
jgi:hypothetical protein